MTNDPHAVVRRQQLRDIILSAAQETRKRDPLSRGPYIIDDVALDAALAAADALLAAPVEPVASLWVHRVKTKAGKWGEWEAGCVTGIPADRYEERLVYFDPPTTDTDRAAYERGVRDAAEAGFRLLWPQKPPSSWTDGDRLRAEAAQQIAAHFNRLLDQPAPDTGGSDE